MRNYPDPELFGSETVRIRKNSPDPNSNKNWDPDPTIGLHRMLSLNKKLKESHKHNR